VIKKDYLLKLLQQVNDVIAKARAKTDERAAGEALILYHKSYKRLLGLNPDDISRIDSFEQLLNKDQLDLEELNAMALLLSEEAETLLLLENHVSARQRCSLALQIFDYLNITEKVYSFERESRIARIQSLLNRLE
jgi:hypothetical protein